jgi:hypothetical protein
MTSFQDSMNHYKYVQILVFIKKSLLLHIFPCDKLPPSQLKYKLSYYKIQSQTGSVFTSPGQNIIKPFTAIIYQCSL